MNQAISRSTVEEDVAGVSRDDLGTGKSICRSRREDGMELIVTVDEAYWSSIVRVEAIVSGVTLDEDVGCDTSVVSNNRLIV